MSLQAATPRLILASASPARRALLAAAGLRFEVRPAAVDEAAIKAAARADGLSPEATALRLARAKAACIDDADALVIGCDQLLVCGETWFDKPGSIAAAATQLRALHGREHRLVTAACCRQGGTELWSEVAVPRLRMRAFSEPFLAEYLAAEGEAVVSCVGAYRLEGPGVQLFDAVEGEHAAVLGMPLLGVLAFLRRVGVLSK
jgi:septum formation protein